MVDENISQVDKQAFFIRLAIAVSVLLLVGGALVWFFFFRSPGTTKPVAQQNSHKTSQSQTADSSAKSDGDKANDTGASAGSATNNQGQKDDTATTSKAPSNLSSNQSGSAASDSDQLTKTGPEGAVALVVTTMLVSTAAFRLGMLKKDLRA